MPVAAKTREREDTASVTKKQKFFSGYREKLCAKNFDETVLFQFEKRRWDARGQMRETYKELQKAVQ